MVGDGMFFLKNKKRNKENRAFFLFLAPSLLGVVIFVVLPFLDVFKRSFTTAVTGQFRGIENYKIIFTKLDETTTYGNILNIKLYSDAEVSYITNGQNVPDDIELFNSQKIVKRLLGGS